MRSLASHHSAIEDDSPTRRRDLSYDDVEKGRFAGTIRADDRVSFTLLDLKIDVGKRLQAPKVLLDVGNMQNCVVSTLGHFTPPLFRWLCFKRVRRLRLPISPVAD